MSRVEQFLPFDSLKGYKEKLLEVCKNKLKIEKPVLSEDQLEELNQIIITGIANNSILHIHYFLDGFIKEIRGKAQKITFDSIFIMGTRVLKDSIIMADYDLEDENNPQ